jgi:molecular chaperone HtpG
LKEGLYSDYANREPLLELVRFKSSTEEGHVSLASYKERMSADQKSIYYITGESKAAVEKSPFLEGLRKKGIEVLYMTDPIDEYAVQQLKEYDGKKLLSCTKEGLQLDETEEEKTKKEEGRRQMRTIRKKEEQKYVEDPESLDDVKK